MNREDQNYLVDYQAGARAKKNGMKEIPEGATQGFTEGYENTVVETRKPRNIYTFAGLLGLMALVGSTPISSISPK